MATDNCGATVTKSFTLTVIPPFGATANLVATATNDASSGAKHLECRNRCDLL